MGSESYWAVKLWAEKNIANKNNRSTSNKRNLMTWAILY
jgi:hypothetical protein